MPEQEPTHAATRADRSELLERRWRRERAARQESERIAEAGLRRLWEAKNEVDRQVEERTRDLRIAHRQAEAAGAAKTEFLANLSHEVRTPLQTILGALELMPPAPGDDGGHTTEAIRATRDLRDLFDNLLELAQCEVGSVEFDPTPTDLQRLADELDDRWRTRMTGSGLLLVPESSGTARIDPVRLVQIGNALLDNATRFARPGTVRLGLHRVDDEVRLVVADDGPGVDPELLDQIFVPFVQVSGGNDRTVSGAGIGLALVRGLATGMGGSAAAGPAASGGLAVTVVVPTDPADGTARTTGDGA